MDKAYEIVQEQLRVMSLDLPASDRFHYVDNVMEAMTVKGNEAQMMYAVYKDIQKINDVDFGKIPDSRGNITKYVYYTYLQKSLETLMSMSGAENIEVIQLADKIHTILLNYRRDFEFGYNKNIDMITITYETLGLELYALIDLSISEYTKYLKLDFQAKNLGKFNAKESLLIAQARNMVKTFDSGNWNLVMKTLRNYSAKQTQQALMPGNEPITEAVTLKVEPEDAAKIAEMGTTVLKAPITGISMLWKALKDSPWYIKTAIIVISILLSCRTILFVLGKISGFLAGCARNQAELLRGAIDAKGDDSGKKQKWVDRLEGLADRIEFKYNKAEKIANKDIAESNRENFGTTAIIAGSIPQGVDFGF